MCIDIHVLSTTARKAFQQNSQLEFLIHYLFTSQQILSLRSGYFEERIRWVLLAILLQQIYWEYPFGQLLYILRHTAVCSR